MKLKKHFLLPLMCGSLLFNVSCTEKPVPGSVNLIPQVQSVEFQRGSLPLNSLQTICTSEEWKTVAEQFMQDFKNHAGCVLQWSDNSKSSVRIEKSTEFLGEAYVLKVTADAVILQAGTEQGVARALTTLYQLLLTAENNELPALTIQDQPRFSYRGLMLDCSRHFWTVDELKKTISQMAFFKLNTLHLHLTDNNAWRLAMDKYPELTEKGTFYADYPELSGKFYTKDDLKEVVRYAALYGVEIMPEVDLPGHSTALLAAMPQLSCNGGAFEAYPEEMPVNERKRGNENMICVGNPASYAFAEEVVNTLIEIFPSKYIHLGGDEVPTHVWEKCPKCMALYKKEGMKQPGELQDYFTRKMSELVRSKGKIMVGWDEINERHAATSDDVLTVWRDTGEKQQKEALERHIPVIMCPQHGCYLDWGYAGNSVRKSYEWDPVLPGVTKEQEALIKGGQGALWTERVATQSRVEWMLYPRLSALAEVLWSPKEQRNWDSFYQRITSYYPVMEKLGINFYEDDALNEKEFVPTEEKPALIRAAHIDTNIPVNMPYHPEYAFDGRNNSFFWGGSTVGKEHYFTVLLTEATPVKEIEVITGDSKDYITKADLMTSTDGTNFVTVGTFDEYGQAKVQLNGEPVKAVKIQVTGQHTCWPIIKEIILK
jgi:hexosaminidase